jgi:hypothetical protein
MRGGGSNDHDHGGANATDRASAWLLLIIFWLVVANVITWAAKFGF